MTNDNDINQLFNLDGVEGGEVELLRTLIQSPIFSVFKKVTSRHKREYEGILLNAKESYHVHRAQGVILGLSLLENLPDILVRRDLKNKEVENAKEEIKKRMQRPVVKPESGGRI